MKKKFLDFGMQPITNAFLTEDKFDGEYFYNLSIGIDEDNKLVFFKLRMEWVAIVAIITIPPITVSLLGCSFITSQTQRGPNIVSSKKRD